MKRGFDRAKRVADLIQKTLALMLLQDMNDERFNLVTITFVEVSRDLSYAKVYVSILLDDKEKIKEVVYALNRSAKPMRYQLAKAVDLRIVPELKFVYDESTAHGFHISQLIDSAVKKSEEKIMTLTKDGILLIDKPIHQTSNAVLQRVKRLFNVKKAGHTGSLDPLATGMLPLCFGEATKFSQFLLDADKSYEVVAQLGIQTSTGDSEGEVIATKPLINITAARIEAVMKTFLGEIDQVPPMFSALKYQGKPLYKLARQGIEVERKPRRITIFSLELTSFDQHQFSFRVHCSKGTYVRTLVEEIGKHLNCGAHVIALRRTMVTPYGQASMYTIPVLESMAAQSDQASMYACLLPIETAVQILPQVSLSTSAAFYLRLGQSVRAPYPAGSTLVRLIGEEGRFLGIGEVLIDGRIKPHRLLAA